MKKWPLGGQNSDFMVLKLNNRLVDHRISENSTFLLVLSKVHGNLKSIKSQFGSPAGQNDSNRLIFLSRKSIGLMLQADNHNMFKKYRLIL